MCVLQDHTRFVQAVRYSPTGSHFASGGFDGKVFLYDGVSADLVGEIGSPAHKGGVYGVSISPPEDLATIVYTCLVALSS